MAGISNTAFDNISHRTPFSASLQECFELALHLEAGYQLSEGINLTIAATIKSLQAEDINEIQQGKDARARSNACFKCGMTGHFVREGTADTVDTADDTSPSSVVGKYRQQVQVLRTTAEDKYCRT